MATNSVENNPRIGRPTKLTARDKRSLLRQVQENPTLSAPKLASQLAEDVGKEVSPECVRRVSRNAGYRGRTMRKKPCISEVNRIKRLNFAKKHLL